MPGWSITGGFFIGIDNNNAFWNINSKALGTHVVIRNALVSQRIKLSPGKRIA